MPPIKFKFVVSFTSQDEKFKAINLVSSDGFKKWLSHPKERSGETSVTLQLENECTLSYIDIGTHWCANIEIQVGRSDWPIGKEYQILAPTCIMMKPMDCNLGRNFACTRMFSEKDFNSEVASHLWDRVKIICRQPLKRDKQFGLSFLRVKTANAQNSSDTSSTSQQKSVQSIQKHFFGKTKISNSPVNEMKTKLLKMVGSSENGTEQEEAMSRTAKLVLAASKGSKPKEPISNKSPFYSDMLAQKHGPEFQEEVNNFLSGLTINEDELDRVTIADLRHKLERKKRRKLDKDERKTFAEMARNYICKLFGESDDEKMNSEKEASGKFCESVKNKNNVNERETTQIKNKVKSPSGKLYTSRTNSETYGDFEITSDLSSPKPANDRINTNIVDQLKNIRQNAHQIYKTNLEKKQSDENYSPSHHSSQNAEGTKYKNVKKTEDDVYKSMTYLERKAFALTNPYKINRYGASLSFGPSKGENDDDDDMSPKKSSLSNTNNEWLSKVNQMLTSPPSTGGKRKRGSNGARGGKASKVPRNLDKNDYASPVQCKGRGRGRSVSAKEVIPTSFERCPNCKETFPPAQFSNHKRTCIDSDRCRSPDIVEDAYSGPTVVDNLRSPEYVECPMCSEFYSADVVQFHAAVCGDVV